MRFERYNELSIEELKAKREEIIKSINDMIEDINDKKTNGNLKSELNEDIKYEREKLQYIENLIQNDENNLKK